MMNIALPSKGALSDEAVRLVSEAGYHCNRPGRQQTVTDRENDIEFYFIRPRDIAVYVSKGIFTLGITGRDLALDSDSEYSELLPLEFGHSRFCYAVPRDRDLHPDQFSGMRIASSYVNVVNRDLQQRGVHAELVRLDGAVEISVRLGVADAIADVVESGRTLERAGLKIVGDSILDSEAILIGGSENHHRGAACATFVNRLQGILMARKYMMVEYDIPEELLEQAVELTPGIESPTVSPLNEPNWLAVKSMIERKDANRIMDALSKLGAKGVLLTDIRSCRL